MSKLGQLQGSPWHTEKFSRKPGDKRRHRNRCAHYNRAQEFCEKEVGRCRDAAHCRFYYESVPEGVTKTPQPESKKIDKAPIKKETADYFSIAPGTVVRHKKFGVGMVTEMSNGVATVAFDSGEKKKLDLKGCELNGLLTYV